MRAPRLPQSVKVREGSVKSDVKGISVAKLIVVSVTYVTCHKAVDVVESNNLSFSYSSRLPI